MVEGLIVGVFTLGGVILGFFGGRMTVSPPATAERPKTGNLAPLAAFFAPKSDKITPEQQEAVNLFDEYLNGPRGE